MKKLITSVACLLSLAAPAFGHGTMADPISRSYEGFLENPQAPQSNAVLAAVAVGGTQAFYDWNEVSRNIPGYDYQAAIPDGQIPGAGRSKYAGLNLPRTDWPATSVVAGPRVCRFYATTPHDPSFFKAWITRDGYDPTQPLRWADLVEIAGAETAQRTGPCGQAPDVCHCEGTGSNYYMTLQLPPRTGRHILYVSWQRIDPNNEVFFSTSDLDYGGVDYGPPPPPPVISAVAAFSFASEWNGGGQGNFRITNNTQQAIQGWSLEFDWLAQSSDFWNGALISRVGNHFKVGNASYNGTIQPGGFVDVGCSASYATPGLLPTNVIAYGGGAALLPIVSSSSVANGTVGQPFSYQITASGLPTSYSAIGLADGLSVNPTTGVISGVPATACSCVASIKATNANGTGTKLLTVNILSCRGDMNGDGKIDGADLATMLARWGQPGPCDFTNDGTTDGSDLGILLQAWGSCG